MIAGLVWALIAGFADEAPAGEQPPSAPLTEPAAARPPPARIDRWHDSLYDKVQSWALGLDRSFVRDGETPEPTPSSPFRISLDAEAVHHPDGFEFKAQPDIDLLLQLPNLERRLKLFITSDELTESPFLVNDRDRRVRAGGRLALSESLNFDLGVRVDLPPVAFTAVRWQRQMGVGGWDIEPFAKVYLETKDGFGAAAGITFDRWMNRYLLRSSSYANWRHDTDETRWTQTLMFAHAREILRFGRYGAIVRGNLIDEG